MRRFQKLRTSVVVLIVVVLAITCFIRGNAQLVFYGASFLVWGIYSCINFVIPAIERYKYRNEVKQAMKEKKNSIMETVQNSKLSYLLLCHANHRITGYIKSIYPDATWAWRSNSPEDIIANSGTGRIELFGVKEYNFADISFDDEANIECSLLKVTSLKKVANSECAEDISIKSEIDPQVWFEKGGRIVLKNLIADLSSRGHNSLTIQEDGSCIIVQGDKELKVKTLDAFPQRVYYPRLIKVFEGAGIAAKTVDSGLSVMW